MKYLSEYRNRDIITKMVNLIAKTATKQHTIMEVCGGQTHAILKYGLDKLLPDSVQLLHGPGCPVCVTPIEVIDQAIQLALQENVIFCSFGDMLRVPGSKENLLMARAAGANIKLVYSPLDAVKIAVSEPNKEVVFFAIGFETTAPANAMAIEMAYKLKIKNFSILIAQFLVPPAIDAILSADGNMVDAFLAAGHVCAVMGFAEYEPICNKYKVPIVVTGFEPIDILQGIYASVNQLENGNFAIENQYTRIVNRDGNQKAKELMNEYFCIATKQWRGIGAIPNSGLVLREKYRNFDAQQRFDLKTTNRNHEKIAADCIAGLILQGIKKPTDCNAFGVSCFPDKPLGAPMVSAEGVCSAYYNYRHELIEERE